VFATLTSNRLELQLTCLVSYSLPAIKHHAVEKTRKEKKRKEKKRKDYAFPRQFIEKPCIILGCPGACCNAHQVVTPPGCIYGL